MFLFMSKKFWVNNYFIDVTRNQIQHQQQATPLPPKALKVLEVLASRAGEVVSHDELMDIVWENSVVGPNTLQRAIAQLRKAFGDDSKQQAFIKTHAKKGYSLEANVRWEDNELKPNAQPENTETVTEIEQSMLSITKPKLFALVTVFIIALVSFWPDSTPVFDNMVPLTASDEQEFNASYSPDGNYLVFNRFVGQCESHLWAKNLRNNQEERLSTQPGHYSELSWSSDGSQLAFVLQSDCADKPGDVKQCWQMHTLDFAQAWNGSASSIKRYDCKQIKTTHPTWLNDGRIAALQYPQPDSNQPSIVIFDAVSNQIETFPYDFDGRIYSLAYSRANDLLATVSLTDQSHHIIRTLSLDGTLIAETEINYHEHYSVYDRFPVSFSPDGEHFLTSIRGQIYTLDFDGELTRIHPPGYTGLWTPVYHPSQKRFAATYGTKDFDIGYLDLNKDTPTLEVMARSTVSEANAQFQPQGELIAFFSRRSGSSQIWINDGGSSYQLTQFEPGVANTRFSWSPDGQRLAVNVGHKVALINLDGSTNFIDVKQTLAPNLPRLAVDLIMPWTHPDKLLVTDNQADNNKLYSIDINTGEVTDVNLANVLWAAYTPDQEIVYLNQQQQVWLNTATQPLASFEAELFSNNLLLIDNQLYGINWQNQFWQLALNTSAFSVVKQLDRNTNYVSDLRGNRALATKFMGGRRELVELTRN